MITNREKLIHQLTDELKEVTPFNPIKATVTWLLMAFTVTSFAFLVIGPFRDGSLHQLTISPQFLSESLFGLLMIILLAYLSFYIAIPSAKKMMTTLVLPLVFLCIWILFYVEGLSHPALEASISNERHACWAEVVIVGTALMLVSLLWVKRLYPTMPKRNGMLVGLVSGSVPALLMQFACMYEPEHILKFHILPGLLVGLFGVAAGMVILKTK